MTDASDAYETITTNEFVMKDAYKTAARVTGVDYTFHDFARILAEDCEKIDFIFVTPQVLVKSCEIPAEVPELYFPTIILSWLTWNSDFLNR